MENPYGEFSLGYDLRVPQVEAHLQIPSVFEVFWPSIIPSLSGFHGPNLNLYEDIKLMMDEAHTFTARDLGELVPILITEVYEYSEVPTGTPVSSYLERTPIPPQPADMEAVLLGYAIADWDLTENLGSPRALSSSPSQAYEELAELGAPYSDYFNAFGIYVVTTKGR